MAELTKAQIRAIGPFVAKMAKAKAESEEANQIITLIAQSWGYAVPNINLDDMTITENGPPSQTPEELLEEIRRKQETDNEVVDIAELDRLIRSGEGIESEGDVLLIPDEPDDSAGV